MTIPPEDISNWHAQREADLNRQQLLDWAHQMATSGIQPTTTGSADQSGSNVPRGTPQPPTAGTSPDASGFTPPTAQDMVTGGQNLNAAVADVSKGLVNIPVESMAGIADAVKNSLTAVRDIQQSFGQGEDIQFSPGLVENPAVQRFLDGKFGPQSDTKTGSLIYGTTKYLAGFLMAGKLRPLQELSELGTAGAFARPAVQGALASFAVLDPQAQRLSDLVQAHPALANPVTEFLAAKPEDSPATGRAKNALEGLGLGLATDGMIASLKALRGMALAKQAAGITDETTAQALSIADQKRDALAVLSGDPAAPAIEVRAPTPEPSALTQAAAKVAADPDQTGKVFVNWAPIHTHDDVKQMIQDLADARDGNIDTARRGARSWEATKLSASQVDAWKVLESRSVGQPLNAEQSVAARELWAQSGAKVVDLANKVQVSGGDLDKIALKRQILLHNMIQEQVIPARTETARALNAWAIPVGDSPIAARQLSQLTDLLAQDNGTIEEIAKRISAGAKKGLTREVDDYLERTPLMKTAAAARQAWYGALLSNPATHIRNIVGNTSNLLLDVAETKVANVIGKLRGQEYVADGEATERLFGLVQGYKDAFTVSQKSREIFEQAADLAAKSGDPEDARALFAADADQAAQSGIREAQGGLRPYSNRTEGAFAPATIGISRDTVPGKFFSFMDSVTTASSRALQRSDEIFKGMTFNAELRAQAYRQAREELAQGGLSKADFADRLAEIMASPTDAMRLQASSAADRLTFSNAPEQTKLWKFVKAWHDVPVLGDITMPFAKTPYNIATTTMAHTPLSPFMKSWREDIMAGGARADKAWAKSVVGNGILLTAADFAMNGLLTGQGPSDPAQRATLQRTGWQPWSVKVGDHYFDYRGIDPIGPLIGLAANTTEVLLGQDWPKADRGGRIEQLAVATSMSIASQITDQSFMSGASNFFNAMQDSRRYGEKWWQQLVASAVVPRGVAAYERTISDPTQRIAWDIGSYVRSQTPGLSKDLPPARNVWGDAIHGGSGWSPWYDYLSPFKTSKIEAQPIDTELERLQKWIANPGRAVSFQGVTIDLTKNPMAYSRYVELSGNAWHPDGEVGLKNKLNAIVEGRDDASEMYETLDDGPDGLKAKLIDRYVDVYRGGARQQLLEEFPELKAEVNDRRRK